MKVNILNKFGAVAIAALALASCSDSFLSDKKNYDNVNADIYNTYEGCNARISDIYSWCLPDPNSDANWKYNCTGNADEQSGSTEEYSGFTLFTDPQAEMMVQNGASTVPDYFHYSSNNIQASVWGRIRNINDAIAGIENGSLSESVKQGFLGQALFFRAWCYYQLVKWYGGVPIVSEVSNPNDAVSTPRSSSTDCFTFILTDLAHAIDYLDGTTYSSTEWGRITQAACLALKDRVLLLWCSPLFNRANDETRWKNVYNEITSDVAKMRAAGYDLYKPGSNVNGSNFASIFSQSKCQEDVFVTVFNTVQSGDYQKNNNWERGIRPKNATGSGLNPSDMIVDQFPMADGLLPSSCTSYTKLPRSSQAYQSDYPFMNRDPRFYRTFAFPGVRWAYNGDATMQDANNPSYKTGNDYELWNYTWYQSADERSSVDATNKYYADNLLKNGKGIYVRKRSDDYDVSSSSLYSNWSASANLSGFAYSAAPYVEIRFAECLLNLAEAAAGANDLEKALSTIDEVRERAGATTGVYNGIRGDQSAVMSAVLYERMVELAYEGKRFDDMRRWLLFDGGSCFDKANIEDCPDDWKLTGWNGNTCTWLGVTPLNDQRREHIEFTLADSKGTGGTTFDTDPLVSKTFNDSVAVLASKEGKSVQEIYDEYGKATLFHGIAKKLRGDVAIDLRKPVADQQDALKAYYTANFKRKTVKGDGYDQNKTKLTIHFFPKYYFLGLPYGALSTDVNLQQTIGWQDTNKGGANGTFDPLAE